MKLGQVPGDFSVCEIKNAAAVSWNGSFVSLTKTKDEISLVCPTEDAPQDCEKREDGWACMKVVGTLNFSLIGILARISGILAENGISIFAVSTYDTDYIFMKKEKFDYAVTILQENGYQFDE